jgi:hypothetical protein
VSHPRRDPTAEGVADNAKGGVVLLCLSGSERLTDSRVSFQSWLKMFVGPKPRLEWPPGQSVSEVPLWSGIPVF